MSIYTRGGDNGTTSLFGGKRLSKSDQQIAAYGSVDELSSFIGLLIEKIPSDSEKKFLTDIQKDLYLIMSALAGGMMKETELNESVKKIEKKIDEIEFKLPKLSRFILPQGSEITALSHVVRTITRRAEREAVGYFEKLELINLKLGIVQYLNRLSDYFFVLARLHNKKGVIVHP